MTARSNEDVPWDGLSVGATRPAVIKGFNIPFWFILPITGLPALVVVVTSNPLWLSLMLVLTALGRWMVATDHNRPRVLLLAMLSGSLFADRGRWGGDSTDPLGATQRAD
jgi:type IV secretory pathway VirB3-like protein